MTGQVPYIVGPNGLATDPTNRSPLRDQKVELFSGFNPMMVSTAIRECLIFFFGEFSPEHLRWTNDPQTTCLSLIDSYDAQPDQAAVGKKPTIVVDRGGYAIMPAGFQNGGADARQQMPGGQFIARQHMALLEGRATVTITTWNKGTAELVSHLCSIFLSWSRTQICNTVGFKDIGPIEVSPATKDKDDASKFIVQISVPWRAELKWETGQIGPRLKDALVEAVSATYQDGVIVEQTP